MLDDEKNKGDENQSQNEEKHLQHEMHNIKFISGMYQNWFLEYASYVILERAVPHIFDGLKPVQRRILHAMRRLEDGRYNKVANVIGYTMQYHPHGDASIGDAMVQLGQKDLMIDMQGNWGNILTGDGSAAPRYIEARLSKFALEVAFNPKTTEWKLSYDGRNKEPVHLPMKFPLLLAQGVEGIAVGLASKILPHNFIELIEASIKILKNEPFELLPDFPTGGLADFSRYNDGLRGGKIRVRARISKSDKKTLVITEIPFGTTTGSLIESILSANEKGKIKIRKVDDNTAANVEIAVHLQPGTDPDVAIDALYAFTDCEMSISPNSCVIEYEKPRFMGVSEILKESTQRTMDLLKLELKIRLAELHEDWHFSSLEKIFIEKRIYRDIEECETWEAIIQTIDKGLEPYKPLFKREITVDDITRLTEIRIKRISKFDAFQADEHIKGVENEMETVQKNIDNIVKFTIAYFRNIRDKFGKNRERKTEIRSFDIIEAVQVAVANEKLYFNREDGFVGTSLKKNEYLFDCSDMDDIIIFKRDGTYVITKVSEKTFAGQNVVHIGLFKKNDDRTIYNVIYVDGESGANHIKRFSVTGVIRDKEYNLTQGTKNSKILYFSANPNGEAESVKVTLRPKPRLRNLTFEASFAEIGIKGRSSIGNILTKNAVHKIVMKQLGASTLGGKKIYFDFEVLRLNIEGRGQFVGEFENGEKIIVIRKNGSYSLCSSELSNHFEADTIVIEKFNPKKVYSAIYFDAEQSVCYLKRFVIEETSIETGFIGDHPNSSLVMLLTEKFPRVELKFGAKDKKRPSEIINIVDFIGIKSHKAKGKRLSNYDIDEIIEIDPIVTEEQIINFENELKEINKNKFEVNFPNGEQIIMDL